MFTRRPVILVLTVLAMLAAAWAGWPGRAGSLPAAGKVEHVLDGDTIILETGEKVRYLGIDAPETGHRGEPSQCHGRKAKEANARRVLGKKVALRYAGETHDQYGRLLAYVHGPDGACVNVELVRAGYAWIYRTPGAEDMFAELLGAQREAITKREGLWGACPVRTAPYYIGNIGTYVFHRPRCPLGREMSVRSRVRFQGRWQPLYEGYHPCRSCRP